MSLISTKKHGKCFLRCSNQCLDPPSARAMTNEVAEIYLWRITAPPSFSSSPSPPSQTHSERQEAAQITARDSTQYKEEGVHWFLASLFPRLLDGWMGEQPATAQKGESRRFYCRMCCSTAGYAVLGERQIGTKEAFTLVDQISYESWTYS